MTENSAAIYSAASPSLPANLPAYDQILLMDLIEHLHDPENFMDALRKRTAGRRPEVIITSANIAFFVTRIMLAFGQFNYSRKGILGIGHRRLFTFNSLRELLQQSDYKIIEMRGIPAPFPKALGDNLIARFFLQVNRALIRLSRGLFSYQIFVRAEAKPTVNNLLSETIEGSATLRQKAVAFAA